MKRQVARTLRNTAEILLYGPAIYPYSALATFAKYYANQWIGPFQSDEARVMGLLFAAAQCEADDLW